MFAWFEKSIDDQRQALEKNDFDAYLHFDRVFHLAFCEMIGNRRFFNILENIRDLIHLMAIQALEREGRWEEVINEHEEIIKTVREGEVVLAKKNNE